MDTEPTDDRTDRTSTDAPVDAPANASEDDVEGHNIEFYRQEARQRAREAEAIARQAARANEARSRSGNPKRT
jgi:hypothetical protein